MRLTHPAQGTLFDGALELTAEGKYLRSQSFRFENILPWDHEHPELYRATLTVAAPDGAVTEVIPYDTGFRRFELKNGLMLLNGERLVLNGVNRHEWNPDIGLADRAKSMFERDKNYVSILFWSCGNESYAGEDILAMAEFFRKNDPSRLVHYEGVFHCREFDRISDVESRMYASPEDIRAYLENSLEKPFILCEYMHDMGNSLGGMESYIRLGEEFLQYQGGFIWDYMDQALWRTDCSGRRVLGYGGDFGWHREVPHIPAYLVPRECGCHVETHAAVLSMADGAKLALEMTNAPFSFSAIPYTPQQLEQTAHREELPEPVRTVVTVCGAMRGVGGIDSWGSDVEEACRVSGETDQEFSFSLRLRGYGYAGLCRSQWTKNYPACRLF